MEGVIISVAICCLLPIASTFIVFFYSNKIMANKMNLLSKAIDSGVDIDAQGLMESLESKKKKTIKERLINKLIWGIILLILGIAAFICLALDLNMPDEGFIYTGIAGTAIGTALVIAYFVGRKLLASEIKAETMVFEERAKNSIQK